ncbi:MAG: SUMF1/EgtB/PvdO family nonheme iron enzyme [Deltaproteobacteria bacterium]|nr:SUMF1/EgtB/PvdO family nonheme iron enzyme [Deltaproteobacteria bacterium]
MPLSSPALSLLAVTFALAFGSACVDRRCFEASDCEAPRVCNSEGRCVHECSVAADCPDRSECRDHRCRALPLPSLQCPADMVAVANAFCLDRYEASRSDSSATSAGSDESMARSAPGVLPWFPATTEKARQACHSAGKRLCQGYEWTQGCRGAAETAYSYGASYDPSACNGIDAFCDCASASCASVPLCPYPHCFNREAPGGQGGPCGAAFHVAPTGSFGSCKGEWGAFDLNGNVWELVDSSDGRDHVRGGAYNCGDSEALHRCDYEGTFGPPAQGFRCCADGTAAAPDAGLPPSPALDASTMADGSPFDASPAGRADGGCAEELADAGAEDATTPLDATAPEADAAGPGDAGAADAATLADAGVADAAAGDGACPVEMAAIGRFCMDRWEASREDATDAELGASAFPTSRPGVQPWWPISTAEARAACQLAGKRLCRADEWLESCAGPSLTAYSYGATYDATACNGIDAFCDCAGPSCSSVAACPYPHCYQQPSPAGSGGPCGASFHVAPTGSFPRCVDAWGVYDLNGNVWELIDSDDGQDHARGGAYNCGDSEALHRCTSEVTWGPPARGFRCCKDQP